MIGWNISTTEDTEDTEVKTSLFLRVLCVLRGGEPGDQ
jgi:hypothetical protein